MSAQQFDEEQLRDLYAAYPDLQSAGFIDSEEIRNALIKLDCPIAGHELRQLLGAPIKPRSPCTLEELYKIYVKARALKIEPMQINKNDFLKEAPEVKEFDGTVSGKHTVTKYEERAFTNWINKHLGEDPELLQMKLIPINSDDDADLYKKCENGIILGKMINKAVPNTIDERLFEKGNSVFKRNENLTLVVNSAAAIGCCVVNIGPEDIASGTRHLICGLIWQLIRKAIVDTITLAIHGELAALLLPGETIESLNALKPEELLMRWVNFHLANAGLNRKLTNFSTDINDSIIYATLMEQIAPADLRSHLISSSVITNEYELPKRAQLVMENAKALDAGALLTAEDIYLATDTNHRDKLNLGFVATLFNLYPALNHTGNVDIIPETLEEKTYRNWMNSMGVTPTVTNLYRDLSNGLVLLQLIDIIEPSTVNWSKVVSTFDERKKLFQMQTNCVLAVNYAKQIGIKLVNVSGENIREGEMKQILGTCFQFMRAYTTKLLIKAAGSEAHAKMEDADILAWVNERLDKVGESKINGFRDPVLKTSKPIVAVLESIVPRGTNRSMLTNDNFSNAVYALSCCRKAGARVYALPEHVCSVDSKMIVTIFACLIILSFTVKSDQPEPTSPFGR